MARRRRSSVGIDDLGELLSTKLGSAVVGGAGGLGLMLYYGLRPGNSSATTLPEQLPSLVFEAFSLSTFWLPLALFTVGVVSIALQTSVACVRDLWRNYKEALWAHYGNTPARRSVELLEAASMRACIAFVTTLLLSILTVTRPEVGYFIAAQVTALFVTATYIAVARRRFQEADRLASVVPVRRVDLDTTPSIAIVPLLPSAVEKPTAQQEHVRASARDLIVDRLMQLQSGQVDYLQTSLGAIRITKCTSGALRLFWPPKSALMTEAVKVVRGQATYRDSHFAWFVHSGSERRVLNGLAQL